jgi:ribose transport system permease protein
MDKRRIRTIVLAINKNWGQQVSLGIALIILLVFFTSTSKYFFQYNNFVNLGHYMPVLGIMAVGCHIALLMGMLDLSQYSILAFSSVIGVLLNRAGVGIVYVFLSMIFIGLLLGAINGFIVTVLKINPIIATIATGMVLRGLSYKFTESRALSIAPETRGPYLSIGRETLLGIPKSLIVMGVVYLIVFLVLKYTRFGKHIFAVGGNSSASFLAGVNIKKIRFGALIISGLTAGLAGFLLMAQLASVQPMVGLNSLLDIVAAVLLGGVALSGGRGRLTGTVLGVIIFVVIQNGMTILGVQTYWQMIVRGIIILIAVFVNVLRGGGFK